MKTFVLGLGCQKGGTAWLYDYLAGSPQFAQGFAKEMAVFNIRDLELEEGKAASRLERAARQVQRAQQGKEFRSDRLLWAAMYADPEVYFDYFAGLLTRSADVRATGDVTPAYSMLSGERVAEIRDRLLVRGVRTVGIFLMRDPVERVWSQARMRVGRRPEGYAGSPEEVVAELFATPDYDLRSRYDHTLRVLDDVLDPADRWIGFYEELFAEAPIREICDRVGLDFREPDLDFRKNASPKGEAALPEEVAQRVARHLRGVYEAVAARFPDRDLARLWPSSRFVL